MNNWLTNIKSIVLIAFISFWSLNADACDAGSVSLNSSTCNPDGTVTYVFDMCLQYYGLEGNPEEFSFTFTGATVTSVATTTVTTDSGEDYDLDNAGIGTSTVTWEGAWLIGNSGNNTKCWQITITTNQAATSYSNFRHHNSSYECGQSDDLALPPCPVPCDASWTLPSALCEDDAPINLNTLITGDAGGTWSGTGVSGNTFDPSGLDGTYSVTYTLNDCDSTQDIIVHFADPSWTLNPTDICEDASAIDLGAMVTGDVGGTWSGTGVSNGDEEFDPTGQSGSITITYSVNDNGCTDSEQHTINVDDAVSAAWDTTTICESDGGLNLGTLITGTTGGTWSGSGVADPNFDPTGLSGNISITYTVTNGTCNDNSTQNLLVYSSVDASWAGSTVCETDGVVNLAALVTGDAGGTWSGTQVNNTDEEFDPTGLTGSIAITYVVKNGTCQETVTDNMTVTNNPDATWDTTTICESTGTFDLTTLESGDQGGTWSGTGVTGTDFDPSTLSGDISITYTVGSGSCQAINTQNILVHSAVDASWAGTSICEDAGVVDLAALVTGDAGGTWTGTQVNNTDEEFDPSGLSGAINITYTVKNGKCQEQVTDAINVDSTVDPSWNTTTHCVSNGTLNLSTLEAGTTGGTWSGTGVTTSPTFDPTGLSGAISLTYSVANGLCTDQLTQSINITSNPNSAWSATSICEGDGDILDLTTLITGDAGGRWTGSGVNTATSEFDPSGLDGAISIQYAIGDATCGDSTVAQIQVNQNPDADWNYPARICDDSNPVDLSNFANETTGTWSGTGIDGNQEFDPAGLDGFYPIQHLVVNAQGCRDSVTNNMQVVPRPATDFRDTTICANQGTIDLESLLEPGSANTGTWNVTSGSLSGSQYDPLLASGAISIDYSISGSCPSIFYGTVNVDSIPDASFRDSSLCVTDAGFNLNELILGELGGSWLGTGVTSFQFEHNGTPGTYNVTYTVITGTTSCTNSSSEDILVIDTPDPSWRDTTLCESDANLNLNLMVTGLPGGTWSGSGVTGSDFNPSGLVGPISITYTAGPASCQIQLTQDILVDTLATVKYIDTSVCTLDDPLDLNLLIKDDRTVNWTVSSSFNPSLSTIGTNAINFTRTHGVCTSSLNTIVTVNPPPVADWTPPVVPLKTAGEPIPLAAFLNEGSEFSGTWSGENVENGFFDPHGLLGSYPIVYEVGEGKCIDQHEGIIEVIAPFSIDFYNAFSPNGDNMNDLFIPLGNYSMVSNYKMSIYNRWGEKVFETFDLTEAWNGHRNNDTKNEAITDTYAWTVEFTDMEGATNQFAGTVLLVQ